MDKFVANLSDRETALIVRDRYERHPVYLTKDFFESGRFFVRLEAALALKERSIGGEEILWPWKHLVERLKKGYEGPDGISALEIRQILYETVKSGDEKKARLAAMTINAMDEKGFMLALAAEEGAVGDMVQELIRTQGSR